MVEKPAGEIKILFINSYLTGSMGGAEKIFCDIVLNIDRSKFSPYVLIFQAGELIHNLESNGIPVIVNNVSDLSSLYSLKKGLECYRFLKKENIQVVVTYHHDADIWGGLIARLAGVPTVISSRRDMGYQLGKKHIWFYRLFGFLFSSYIAVSDAVKREIEKRERVRPEKIEVIHNGVNSELYSDSYDIQRIKVELGIDPSGVVIGMVASFRPIKGHIYLVEAINKLVEKHKNIQVVCVGYKDTEYFTAIKNKIDGLQLQNYFIFTGDRKDIPQLLAVFDIFVISSVNEGFSNAIIEAMAAGKPVVAANSGGNPEAVLHQETGLLFKPCDSQSLADALEQLIEDKNLRERMGKKGKDRVKQDFSFDKMIEKNEELYQKIG